MHRTRSPTSSSSGGQKWCRAGWGTGFLALSERAIDRLTPVISGYSGTGAGRGLGRGAAAARRARAAFRVTNPDRVAQARFAAALEEMDEVGAAVVQQARRRERDARHRPRRRVRDARGVVPRRTRSAPASVVLEPPVDQLTLLTASLFNHGITATTRATNVRLSVHAELHAVEQPVDRAEEERCLVLVDDHHEAVAVGGPRVAVVQGDRGGVAVVSVGDQEPRSGEGRADGLAGWSGSRIGPDPVLLAGVVDVLPVRRRRCAPAGSPPARPPGPRWTSRIGAGLSRMVPIRAASSTTCCGWTPSWGKTWRSAGVVASRDRSRMPTRPRTVSPESEYSCR